MRNKNLLLIGSLVSLSVITVAFVNPFTGETSSVYEPRKSEEPARTGGDAAIEYYRQLNANPATGQYDAEWMRQNRENMIAFNSLQLRSSTLTWMEEGPDNVGGRTRAICIDRNDANHVFAGSVSGGLFVSNNGANNWTIVPGFNQYLRISSMCQTLDGTYYVGTGSSFDTFGTGEGIWSSTDNGVTWTLVPGSTAWGYVDEILEDPNVANKVWIAGQNSTSGLQTYTPTGGFTPANSLTGSSYIDVKLSPDGNVIIAGKAGAGSVTTYVSTDGGNSFNSVSGTGSNQLPISGRSRMEYAISFEKNDLGNWTMYASATQSCLKGVYISEDHGTTWYEIAPVGSSNFDPFSNPGLGCQGSYDHMLGAVRGNPDQVLIGGTSSIYKWVKGTTTNPVFGQWYQKTSGYVAEFLPFYVHADQHEIKWDQNDILYVGSDGGVSKSFDNGENIWISHNRGYNCTQFYSVAFNKFGHTMGGTQDNGTQYKNFTGVTSLEYEEVNGGDGFDCDISHINSEVMFATVYNGDFRRSDDEGTSFEFFGPIASSNFFNTVGRLYENPNDTDSQDSLNVIANSNYAIGDTIFYISKTQQQELMHILTAPLADGDTIRLQDPVQSIFAAGYGGSAGVYITREALRFNVDPEWTKVIATASGTVNCIEFSSNGEVMYVGTSSGTLYVIENLNTYYSPDYDASGLVTTTITGFGSISGIGVDPQDEDHIVVAGGTSLRETNSATTATSVSAFTEITASLPAVSTYDAIIDYLDPNTIVMGTAEGAYVTDNGGSTWVYQAEMGMVPVYAVRQQWRTSDCWNSGVVYLGTFGRGIWSTRSLVGINDTDATTVAHSNVTDINTYPNPMNANGTITFELKERNNVDIYIMDLAGKIILTKNLGEMNAGNVSATINVEDLASGTYVVMIKAGDETGTDKLIVTH